ncbi:MAG: hypothetical protein QOG52_1846 [Frankiaceae bacterium]|nr:hypothetical protein [Frankiaceae bacterium]
MPGERSGETSDEVFPFAFDARVRVPLAVGGIIAHTCRVRLSADRLVVRYGLFHFQTPLANVIDARVTGPYKLWRSAGLRLSGKDSGITFGTSAGPGVCLLFGDRVRVFYPHEACTVTIARPAEFVARWQALSGRG